MNKILMSDLIEILDWCSDKMKTNATDATFSTTYLYKNDNDNSVYMCQIICDIYRGGVNIELDKIY